MNCATCTVDNSASPRKSMKEASLPRCASEFFSFMNLSTLLMKRNHSIHQIKNLRTGASSTCSALKRSEANDLDFNLVESFLVSHHSKSWKILIVHSLCDFSFLFPFQFQDTNQIQQHP